MCGEITHRSPHVSKLMSKELIDNDFGTVSWIDYYDGKAWIRSEQDVEPVIEHATAMRNDGRGDPKLTGPGMKLLYYLPNAVIMELRKKGINMMSPKEEDFRKCDKEIELNYPYLKVTAKKLWRPTK